MICLSGDMGLIPRGSGVPWRGPPYLDNWRHNELDIFFKKTELSINYTFFLFFARTSHLKLFSMLGDLATFARWLITRHCGNLFLGKKEGFIFWQRQEAYPRCRTHGWLRQSEWAIRITSECTFFRVGHSQNVWCTYLTP